jgi:hypothetical protein
MGFAHHCVYLTFHSHMILGIRQYPRVVANLRFADYPPGGSGVGQ